MNPQQALKLLEQVTSQIQTTRDAHLKITEAIEVLKQALNGKNS